MSQSCVLWSSLTDHCQKQKQEQEPQQQQETEDKEPLLKRPHRPKDLTLAMSVLDGDAEFCVGPQAEKIRCRRLTIKSTSPVLGSILVDNWHNGRMDQYIELPDVQPQHFRNFLKYVEDENCISAASFTPQDITEVFKIAKKYSVTMLQEKCRQFLQLVRSAENVITVYQSVQTLDDELQLEHNTFTFIINKFPEIVQTKDFDTLTHSNLCTFLKCDELTIPEHLLFNAVCRWAEAECDRQSLEKTPVNLRFVLQSAIHLIRYPLMFLSDFQLYVMPTKILTEEEHSLLSEYMSIPSPQRQKKDHERIYPFNYKRRGVEPPKTYTVCFYDCVIYNSEKYVGRWSYNLFKVDHPIEILSFGFDGPIQQDAVFDVQIKLMTYQDENQEKPNQILDAVDEIVMAKRERTFHVKFENPIRVQANTFYKVCYALRGPKTIWGVQAKNEIKMCCGSTPITFTYECVDGQVPEIRFTVPSIAPTPLSSTSTTA